MKNKFIVVEGPNLAGKTTIIQKMVEYIKENHPNEKITVTREPGGTELGETIRPIFKTMQLHPYTQALLINALRQQHVQEIIQPAIRRGEVVISDRYYDSTEIYQLKNPAITAQQIVTIKNIHKTFPQPVKKIFLIPTLDVLVERQQKRKDELDQFEGKLTDELIKYNSYFFELTQNQLCTGNGTETDNCLIIPNGNNEEQVFAKVKNELRAIFE